MPVSPRAPPHRNARPLRMAVRTTGRLGIRARRRGGATRWPRRRGRSTTPAWTGPRSGSSWSSRTTGRAGETRPSRAGGGSAGWPPRRSASRSRRGSWSPRSASRRGRSGAGLGRRARRHSEPLRLRGRPRHPQAGDDRGNIGRPRAPAISAQHLQSPRSGTRSGRSRRGRAAGRPRPLLRPGSGPPGRRGCRPASGSSRAPGRR